MYRISAEGSDCNVCNIDNAELDWNFGHIWHKLLKSVKTGHKLDKIYNLPELEKAEMLLSHGTPQKNNNDCSKGINLLWFLYFLCACKVLCAGQHHLANVSF